MWARDAEAHAAFSSRQAERGRIGGEASGKARLAASEDKRASARLMYAQGMSQQAIAAELCVTQQAVSKWMKATTEA